MEVFKEEIKLDQGLNLQRYQNEAAAAKDAGREEMRQMQNKFDEKMSRLQSEMNRQNKSSTEARISSEAKLEKAMKVESDRGADQYKQECFGWKHH